VLVEHFFSPLPYLVDKPELSTPSTAMSEFESQFPAPWNRTRAAPSGDVHGVGDHPPRAAGFIDGVTLTGVKG